MPHQGRTGPSASHAVNSYDSYRYLTIDILCGSQMPVIFWELYL